MIARGGGFQVGNGVNSFPYIHMVGGLVVDMIGNVVAGNHGGGLQLAQFLMGGGNKGLELGPGLVGWIPSFPQLAIVIEHSILGYQLLFDADDLQRGVQGIPGHGVLDGAFDLID